MANTPNTIFSGTAGPHGDRPGPDRIFFRFFMYVFLTLLCPVGVLAYFLWVSIFHLLRKPWWWASVGFGFVFVVGVFTGNLFYGGMLGDYFAPWFDLLGSSDKAGWLSNNWYTFLSAQFWLGLLLGTGYAAVGTGWKWVRRPKYQERTIVPGPFLKRRAQKTMMKISSNEHPPEDGLTVGVSLDSRDERFASGNPGTPYGERVVLHDTESAGHCLITGGTDSGKTSTMLVGIRDVIRMGRGMMFVDCKGGPDVPAQIAEWAGRYNRPFYHWAMFEPERGYRGPAQNPSYYDPLLRGDPSRKKDLIIGSQTWEPTGYYKGMAGDYLQTLFSVMSLVPDEKYPDSFSDMLHLLNVQNLVQRAYRIPQGTRPDLIEAVERYQTWGNQELSAINALYGRISTLATSTAGEFLRKSPTEGSDIDFRKVVDEGAVVVFTLDTSNYQETSAVIAGLIVQDLKTLSSDLRNRPAEKPFHVYVDEFSAVDATNIDGLLSKARDANIRVSLATQALADMARTNPEFVEQVLAILSSFIVHRANTETDAKVFAGLSGLRKKMVERTYVEHTSSLVGSLGAAASQGQSMLEEVEESSIPAGSFQALKQGFAILIVKSPNARYVNPIQVIRENSITANKHASAGLKTKLPPISEAFSTNSPSTDSQNSVNSSMGSVTSYDSRENSLSENPSHELSDLSQDESFENEELEEFEPAGDAIENSVGNNGFNGVKPAPVSPNSLGAGRMPTRQGSESVDQGSSEEPVECKPEALKPLGAGGFLPAPGDPLVYERPVEKETVSENSSEDVVINPFSQNSPPTPYGSGQTAAKRASANAAKAKKKPGGPRRPPKVRNTKDKLDTGHKFWQGDSE